MALPSIFTVQTLEDGRHQPMRNGKPHFEAFDDFMSAHCACKAAEQRVWARHARVAYRAKAEA